MIELTQTVASLTTPPGRGGIAVIVLAGPQAGRIVTQVFRPWKSHVQDQPSGLRLGHLVSQGEVLDEAVVCRVGGEGDGIYEINIHGGPLVARQAMELLRQHGVQVVLDDSPEAPASFPPAHPPWNNPAIGKEMLAALPLAQSELVLCALSHQWTAGISKLAREAIDEQAATRLRPGFAGLKQAADAFAIFDKLLHPAEVVVIGPPNAGKSTLVNALLGRPVSIVHQQPGTTRDYVRELALFRGVPVYLTDTAGLWEDATGVDAQAVARARHRAMAADLVLMTEPAQGDEGIPPASGCVEGVPPACREGILPSQKDLPCNRARDHSAAWLDGKPLLRVATKIDCCPPKSPHDVALSAHTGQGLDDLKAAVLAALGLAAIDPATPMAFTKRQAELLRLAAQTDEPAAALRDLLEG